MVAGADPVGADPDGVGAAGPVGAGVCPGVAGAAGWLVAGSVIEPPRLFAFAIMASASEVAMKMAARMTVVRDSALAAPRPDIRPETPPPPPKPSAPPSERCSKMVPTMAIVTINWTARRMAVMNRVQRREESGLKEAEKRGF